MSRTFSVDGCDFSGWATRNDIKCSDGRIIRRDAFKHNDNAKVPLVWNHQHADIHDVLGHAYLENRDEGVYAYCFFNDTEAGEIGKALVKHGDIRALSIYANQLQQNGPNVIYGCICEVSLVHKGANPGAFIDSNLSHADGTDDDGVLIYTGMPLYLSHSEIKEEEKNEKVVDEKKNAEKTLGDIINSMTEDQQNVMYALIGRALEASENKKMSDDEEDNNMKHNVFENDQECKEGYLSHSDQESIIAMAKSNSVGSLRTALDIYAEQNPDVLSHGINQIDTLFPEYKDVRPGAPEMITVDMGWVDKVLKKVHKSPISRIRTRQADLRNVENLRATGYKKGTKKGEVGNFSLVHRTTDPQTVFVKSKIDRDDIIDIQDFDVVNYLYNIDRMNLNLELATAILTGDGRAVGADGKIAEDKIRPIWSDDELYTIHTDVDIAGMKATLQGTNTSANFGENYIYAEAVIQSLLYAREKYKGSGSPDFFCAPHLVNVMLLARDLNGRRIYDKVSDLAAALNVNEIITVEQFEGKTRTTSDNKTKKILGLMINLNDYSLGATKGGEITHFTDFDIDFNQEKSLLETRCSGANTRVFSAIALEEDVTPTSSGDSGDNT
nr:MAG TPA_asm: major capsid protein [Caudoviricetes sp.]